MITIVTVDERTRQLVGFGGAVLMTLKSIGPTFANERMFDGFIVEDVDENKTKYQYSQELNAFVEFCEAAPTEPEA